MGSKVNFSEGLFKIVISLIGGLGVFYISQMQSSISELNKNVATVIEKTRSNEKVLETHDTRIRYLERTSPSD